MTSPFSHQSALRSRIESKEACVMTVGLGYVGLPLALTVSEAGFRTIGLDIDEKRVAAINAGAQVISYFAPDRIARAVAEGRFEATAMPHRVAEADILLICVPTPLGDDREPDLSYVRRAGAALAQQIRPGQLVVLESTVWPGATATVLRPILEQGGLRAGIDFFLAFSPEREDPGNATHTTRTIPKVVAGDDKRSGELVRLFYEQIVERVVQVSSTATAEAVKLAENSFRSVNIALVNEMKTAFGAMGVDVWEVVEAAATKPFGYMPFYPGPGIGGDCIPVSPVYLSWRARDVGTATPIVDLACASNDSAPHVLADRVAAVLAARTGRTLHGARMLILGIAYKRNVEDTRESPALALLNRLETMGAACDYHDPYFPVMPATRDHAALAGRESVPLTRETLAGYDAVIVTTDHSDVDYRLVAEAGRLVFDTRNVFDGQGIELQADRLAKI